MKQNLQKSVNRLHVIFQIEHKVTAVRSQGFSVTFFIPLYFLSWSIPIYFSKSQIFMFLNTHN